MATLAADNDFAYKLLDKGLNADFLKFLSETDKTAAELALKAAEVNRKIQDALDKRKHDEAVLAQTTARDTESGRHNRATEANAAAKIAQDKAADDAEKAMWTPGAIELAAQTYVQTGTLPPLGMGKAGVQARATILNRSAVIADSMGGPEGQAARNALYKANAAELVKLQSQRGPVLAFEKTAEQNLSLAQELSNKVDRSGMPVFNRWNLSGRKAVQGDPEVAAFDAAVRVAINETAKVTSGASGGAVTSDAARHEIESMLNSAMTKAQFDSVVKVLRTDMSNRMKGYEEQIKTTMDALRAKPSAGGAGREKLSRGDSRYRALRERGMTDEQIITKYGVDID
jgi:hypothetical protein